MRSVIFMFLFVVANLSFAQTGHLTFKGIPIDGHINSFIEKMETKGFEKKEINKTGNIAIMTGSFVGKSCAIIVLATEKTFTVSKVIAITSEYISWTSLKFDYKRFKDLYVTKYGTPSNKYEFFAEPYYEGDGYELQALKKEKCFYASFFGTEEGNIAVMLSSDAKIKFVYEDKQNMDILLEEKHDKVLNEI